MVKNIATIMGGHNPEFVKLPEDRAQYVLDTLFRSTWHDSRAHI